MGKEKRAVKWPRRDSYVDSDGVYHPHQSSRWSETEVEIDQFGNPIEWDEHGRILRKGGRQRKDSADEPINPDDDDSTKCRKLVKKEHKRRM